mgnify:CR=1 FL=1
MSGTATGAWSEFREAARDVLAAGAVVPRRRVPDVDRARHLLGAVQPLPGRSPAASEGFVRPRGRLERHRHGRSPRCRRAGSPTAGDGRKHAHAGRGARGRGPRCCARCPCTPRSCWARDSPPGSGSRCSRSPRVRSSPTSPRRASARTCCRTFFASALLAGVFGNIVGGLLPPLVPPLAPAIDPVRGVSGRAARRRRCSRRGRFAAAAGAARAGRARARSPRPAARAHETRRLRPDRA